MLLFMHRRALIALACVALVMTACDSAATSSSAVPSTQTTSTTVMPSLESEPDDSIDCPNFVPSDEAVSDLPSVREQRLYAPAEKITLHVFTNTAEFGGARVIREPIRIEVGVKTNINANCWALRDLVGRDDTFHVVRVPHSLIDVQVAADAAAARGATTPAVEGQSVEAHLPASGETVAAELHAEFGDMLELSVGGWSYPVPQESDQMASLCRSVASPTATFPDLRINAVPLAIPIHAVGGGYRLDTFGSAEVAVRLENAGSEAISFSLPQASLALYAKDQPMGILTGFINVMSALTVHLEPGEAMELSAVVGMSPCSVDAGYSLPPGNYTMGALLTDGSGTVLGPLDDPVEVEVVEAPSEPLPPRTVPSVTAPLTTVGS